MKNTVLIVLACLAAVLVIGKGGRSHWTYRPWGSVKMLDQHLGRSRKISDFTPVVLWHGMGDNCCNPWSMGEVTKMLRKHMKGVHVHSLMIGSNAYKDTLNGFFMPVNDQVEVACQQIQKDAKLKNGYNAMGFSQGGQFLRAVAQRCPQGMKNLLSFGGQHQGIYGLPKCPGHETVCDYVRRLLNYGAYTSWIQDKLVQAEYWHDPLDHETYRQKSVFLADINNDKDTKNETYKENLAKLDKLVLIKFNNDTVVVPKGTEWFGFYDIGQSNKMLPANETDLYQQDWIGLKSMTENGKVDYLSVDGDHLQFDETFFAKLVQKYLS